MKYAFQRIAIVNRGEPAMRLIHAVRELNEEVGSALQTVALFTEPDRRSMFVREAEEAYCLGPASFVDPHDDRRKSKYLDYEALKQALVESRAHAAWVGWGFVAEHADFADLCAELGVTFIGPAGDVMRRVGDKISSKQLAEEAQVPVAPWSGGPARTLEEALAHGHRLGFPLMIKATAGGGGRGVRRVNAPEQLADAWHSAQSEALKAFGSDTVFLERAIQHARHVEVQVLADHHGHTWAVGVRDCTIQRRNQKILEEGPAPTLDSSLEQALRAAAVRLCRAANYTNAGTVEFLLEPNTSTFYFMEMNTRLQVEHPVTEMTTGWDLVKSQLHVANGGRLATEPPPAIGHAIEVRLNAEDPEQGFAPAPGRVALFRLPTGPGLRIDTGIREGDCIAADFDSMIAKLIAHGRTRDEALARLRRALRDTAVVIHGGRSNQTFLLELLSHPDVVANRTDIGWLDRVWQPERQGLRPHGDIALLQAALDAYDRELSLEKKNFFVSASRGRPMVRTDVGRSVELSYAQHKYVLHSHYLGRGQYRVNVDGQQIEVSVDRVGELECWLTCGSVRHRVISVVDGVRQLIDVDGVPHRISRDDGGAVRAPAPSIVLAVQAQPGDVVQAGAAVVVLEAMKMEMSVVAPYTGHVRSVLVRPNVQVAAGAPLLLIDPNRGASDAPTGKRVSFGLNAKLDDPVPSSALGLAIAELKRLLLGYDVAPEQARALREAWLTTRDQWPRDADEMRATSCEILGIFADLAALQQDEPAGAFEQRLSAEECLHTYLRSVGLAGKGLPPRFVERLSRVLRHYGVEELEPTRELDEALFFAYRASQRLDQCAEHVLSLLEFQLPSAFPAGFGAPLALRDLLDRLVAATQDRFLPVNDLARQARFCLFDRPLYETAQANAHQAVRAALLKLGAPCPESERAAAMDAIVQCPLPLFGLLAFFFSDPNTALRRASLEALLRRYYRIHQLEKVVHEQHGQHSVVIAEYQGQQETKYVVATHATRETLSDAIQAVRPVLLRWQETEQVALDVYATHAGTEHDWRAESNAIDAAIEELRVRLSYVCFTLSRVDREKNIRSFTLVPDQHGQYRQHQVHPGMHPMVAERLEVWRLANFRTEQLPAPEHIYLFRAVAHDNPKDDRLLALVDVPDVTPVRDEAGQLVELPPLEHLYLEAVAGIREFQARRGTRERLQWNRMVLFLRSNLNMEPVEMRRIARRLAPATRNLGLEKTVVRISLPDSVSGRPVERVLHISDRAGTGLRLRIDGVSEHPIRPLNAYAQKVIQMRRLGLVYPYEIIRVLTPAPAGEHTEFPPGDFAEYDLDGTGCLRPVEREPGGNQANVVVGIIRNYTAKHPEGMARVMLLGDPSREMGALAEPECRRIIAAFDLAEQLGIPVDWYPVSSGAKIAMEVGTEGLDWVARVLKRIVQYTQRGGVANVVVSGINVGAQSYWDAEATMLMHTKGILVMTPPGAMVLTGKRALDYSGGVSADTNQGIGGFERIMGPNGEAQYFASSAAEACHILLRHYEHTYVVPGERFPRRGRTSDPFHRDVCSEPHASSNGGGFEVVGDIFSADRNPGRKKPFDIRSVMRAVSDKDCEPMERWLVMRDAETAVTWDAHLGGIPVCLMGIESKPLQRFGPVPGDGPEAWTGGTLFPRSSKKVARAVNAASGNRPVVILANLSGFDGSPESMHKLQLEYGAEIGRAVVNFDGPMVFCVISRYHGGAYVVFSCTLNDQLEVAAIEGSHASVIGGAPAAAVVFPGEVRARTLADPRIKGLAEQLAHASDRDRPRLSAHYEEVFRTVFSEKQGVVADHFDGVHSVQRAKQVGSLHHIIRAVELRPYLISAVERGMARVLTANASRVGGNQVDGQVSLSL
ncbi:carboxyl transferase domain-containing protein [Myxococcota bacterium]